MLIRRAILDRIAEGTVSLAFRRWRRPTVKPGGTLVTAIGLLAIDAVDAVDEAAITARDATRAGHASLAALRQELTGREGTLYRIRLRHAGADPRIALRDDSQLDDEAQAALGRRLESLDRAAPWTRATLDLIHRHPGRRAAELAGVLGMETLPFKARVRKLKALGLTESLEVGYRLSPRGQLVRSRLRDKPRRADGD
jgi:hypothetical protein